jgi:hypothetical protein
MALATLSIDLVAQLAKLQQGLDKAGRLAEKSAAEIEARYAKLRAGAAAVGAALGGAVSIAGLAEFLRGTAEAGAQIERLATLAGTSGVGFQKLAAGAKSVGIENDKLADILKDVQDKVGDFAQTGGGGMADFFEKVAPRVGVTADQFRRLSGPEALQLYVSSLEKANVSQSDMIFYLEAVASDSSLLLPLLRNNGAEFGRLGDAAERAGAVMSDSLVKSSAELQRNISELQTILKGFANQTAEVVVPVANAFWDAITGRAVGGPQALNSALVEPLKFALIVGGNVVFALKDLGRELAALAAAGARIATGNFGGLGAIRDAVRADSEAGRKELEAFEKRIQRVGLVLPQASYSNEGRVPVAALSDASGKGGKGSKDSKSAVAKLSAAGVINAEFAGKLEASLAKDGALSPGNLLSIEEALKGVNGDLERTFELLNQTPSAKLEETRKDMLRLKDAFEQGLISAEQFSEAAQTRLGTLPQEVKPVVDDMQEYLKQFQRNVQDILGDGVESVLQGNFNSIGQSFGDLLRKMAAQAIAADIGNQLFGKLGADGNRSGGVFASLLGSLGGLFGFAKGGVFASGVPVKAFANGGVVGGPAFFGMQGGLGLMGEAGPEAIMPLRRGRDGKLGVAGGSTVVNNYNISAGVQRSELMAALQMMATNIGAQTDAKLRRAGVA